MKSEVVHYAGYAIKIFLEKEPDAYDYQVINKEGEILKEDFDIEDKNAAFVAACMWINDKT